MHKTASEIADIVLEKMAVSPQLARRVLAERMGRIITKNPQADQLQIARKLLKDHPRSMDRGFNFTYPTDSKALYLKDDARYWLDQAKRPRRVRKFEMQPANGYPFPSGGDLRAHKNQFAEYVAQRPPVPAKELAQRKRSRAKQIAKMQEELAGLD